MHYSSLQVWKVVTDGLEFRSCWIRNDVRNLKERCELTGGHGVFISSLWNLPERCSLASYGNMFKVKLGLWCPRLNLLVQVPASHVDA